LRDRAPTRRDWKKERERETHEDLESLRRVVLHDDGSEGYRMTDPLAQPAFFAERNDGVGSDVWKRRKRGDGQRRRHVRTRKEV